MIMTKSIPTYIGFALACVVVIFTFVSATTYAQLALAALLYPPLLFFAYKFLPIINGKSSSRKAPSRPVSPPHDRETVHPHKSDIVISDLDKRAFLKLIGSTGIFFFLISIFGRRIESLIFGQSQLQPSFLGNPPAPQTAPTASPTDGYTISEIDDRVVGYYGFVNQKGGWFIMQEDSNTGSFRYAKGDSNFPQNWEDREGLKYDYFHDVFH